ncbi:hypothetical protein KGM_209066 [Danaus plexippus plexippus]|uniref:Uncharacterized protein n=1 Tax=Danaus plexippus plexippus TaxID=278856 RepID=A0A212EW25_DANPL|nr:hypothetical protein KGM_209066 [Danaus plexippus plexippus]
MYHLYPEAYHENAAFNLFHIISMSWFLLDTGQEIIEVDYECYQMMNGGWEAISLADVRCWAGR